MIVYSGPASTRWKPFGGLGQLPANVVPEPKEPVEAKLSGIATGLGLLVAGGLIVYLVMTFSGDSVANRRHP